MTFISVILARSQALPTTGNEIHQKSNRTALCAVVFLRDGLTDLIPIVLELLVLQLRVSLTEHFNSVVPLTWGLQSATGIG